MRVVEWFVRRDTEACAFRVTAARGNAGFDIVIRGGFEKGSNSTAPVEKACQVHGRRAHHYHVLVPKMVLKKFGQGTSGLNINLERGGI